MEIKGSTKRKLSRNGGSVVVVIPKDIRRSLNLGVGDKMEMWEVEGEHIIMRKMESVRNANTRFRS
ncbi:hypothetical protein ES708_27982 [subsurface metagenome]